MGDLEFSRIPHIHSWADQRRVHFSNFDPHFRDPVFGSWLWHSEISAKCEVAGSSGDPSECFFIVLRTNAHCFFGFARWGGHIANDRPVLEKFYPVTLFVFGDENSEFPKFENHRYFPQSIWIISSWSKAQAGD